MRACHQHHGISADTVKACLALGYTVSLYQHPPCQHPHLSSTSTLIIHYHIYDSFIRCALTYPVALIDGPFAFRSSRSVPLGNSVVDRASEMTSRSSRSAFDHRRKHSCSRSPAATAAMEASAGRTILRALGFLFLVLCFCASPAFAVVNDKCSACKAVALELEESLANERPRNHLDYRHRLDSKGQREGKVIDYRVSELRVVDLLDGLCAKMKPYVPNKAGSGREFWLKVEGGVPDSPEMAFNRQATELHSRAIVEFCGRLLETTEEELTEKIRIGEVATGDVQRVLCEELSKSCKETSETAPPADDVEDFEDDEVGSGSEDLVKEKAEESAKDTISYSSDGEL